MNIESMRLRHHALYRAFDRNGSLLYVGITLNLPARIATHFRDAMWWSEVCSISIEHHSTRESALRAESTATATESPLYNTIGVPGRRAAQANARLIAPLCTSNGDSDFDADVELVRSSILAIAHSKAEMKRIRAAMYAIAYRMKRQYGVVEASRRLDETISNINYFALKGEALQ